MSLTESNLELQPNFAGEHSVAGIDNDLFLAESGTKEIVTRTNNFIEIAGSEVIVPDVVLDLALDDAVTLVTRFSLSHEPTQIEAVAIVRACLGQIGTARDCRASVVPLIERMGFGLMLDLVADVLAGEEEYSTATESRHGDPADLVDHAGLVAVSEQYPLLAARLGVIRHDPSDPLGWAKLSDFYRNHRWIVHCSVTQLRANVLEWMHYGGHDLNDLLDEVKNVEQPTSTICRILDRAAYSATATTLPWQFNLTRSQCSKCEAEPGALHVDTCDLTNRLVRETLGK